MAKVTLPVINKESPYADIKVRSLVKVYSTKFPLNTSLSSLCLKERANTKTILNRLYGKKKTKSSAISPLKANKSQTIEHEHKSCVTPLPSIKTVNKSLVIAKKCKAQKRNEALTESTKNLKSFYNAIVKGLRYKKLRKGRELTIKEKTRKKLEEISSYNLSNQIKHLIDKANSIDKF